MAGGARRGGFGSGWLSYSLMVPFTCQPSVCSMAVIRRYPYRAIHPANPNDFVKRRSTVRVAIGQLHLAGWGLAEDEFIEPGDWVVQLRHGGELLAEKMFEIVLP